MSEARESVRRNLLALMASRPNLASQAALSRAAGVSLGMINGLLNDEPGEASEPRLDIIEKLARAYELDTWQLLYPNLEPDNKPVAISKTERAIYDRMRQSARDLFAQDAEAIGKAGANAKIGRLVGKYEKSTLFPDDDDGGPQ